MELKYPPDKAYLKMIFFFPRWDMWISWRVHLKHQQLLSSISCCRVLHLGSSFVQQPQTRHVTGWGFGGGDWHFCRILKKTSSKLHWFSGWWFQMVFIFTPTWGDDPIWLLYRICLNGLKPVTRFISLPSWSKVNPLFFGEIKGCNWGLFFSRSHTKDFSDVSITNEAVEGCYCWWFRNQANQLRLVV